MAGKPVVRLFLVLASFWSASHGFEPTDNLERGFNFDVPGPIGDFDEEFTLACQLPEGKTITEVCRLNGPHQGWLTVNVQDGSVFKGNDTNGEALDTMTGITGDPRTCGIMVKKSVLTKDDLGQWFCHVKEDENPFYQGTFNLIPLDQGWFKDIRLPRHMTPLHYDISLEPDLDPDGNFTTDGMVEFKFKAETTDDASLKNKIVLHAEQLIIEDDLVTVMEVGGSTVEVIGYEYDKDRQFYILHLAEDMTSGKEYTVNIMYTSILNDALSGFYRSSYMDAWSGEKKWLAVTQLENTGARQAFPCMDEPDRKAKFTISITHDKTMTAVSNMPIKETTEIDANTIKDSFEESKIMSTYLVACLVADFTFTPDPEDNSYKVYYRDGKADQAAFAAGITRKFIEYYANYFNLTFPLPKMDVAAVPDFGPGAMENWGLITFKEDFLFYKPEVSSQYDREFAALVLSHELSHQWFGNIVTMKWWNDLWLNEGFASYVMYLGMDGVFPEWENMARSVIKGNQGDYKMLDALQSSQAITVTVTNPDFDATFGPIAYDKGGALCRMINGFLTEDTFKTGLRSYLKEHSYDNAESKDLWDSLSAASNLSVNKIMESWTTKPGYPVVSFDGKDFIQERFFLNSSVKQDDTLWSIPISVAYPNEGNFNDTTPKVWLINRTLPVTISKRPFVLNVQQTGYYRVNYNIKNWLDLTDMLMNEKDFTKIHRLNRAQMVDDVLNLARAERIEYKYALDLASYLKHETDYIPWEMGLLALDFIATMMLDDEPMLKEFMMDLLEDRFDDLGFLPASADEPYLAVLNRASISARMCALGEEECLIPATTMFTNWMADPVKNTVPVDLHEVVYATGIAVGGKDEWDFMFDQFQMTDVDSERKKFMAALGASRNESILMGYLNKTLDRDASGVRIQDVAGIYAAITGSSRIGRETAMTWLETYWEAIKESFGEGANFLGGGSAATAVAMIVDGFSTGANSGADIDRINKFYEDNAGDMQYVKGVFESSLEKATLNKDWMNNNQQEIKDWLKEYLRDDDDDDDDNSANDMSASFWLPVFTAFVIIQKLIMF